MLLYRNINGKTLSNGQIVCDPGYKSSCNYFYDKGKNY